MKAPKTRKHIADGVEPVGMWAVFRKTIQQKARFSCLHETRISALDEAQRLAAESIAIYGAETEPLYFVVLVDSIVGVRGGKLLDGKSSALDALQTDAYAEGRKDESEYWIAETGIDARP